jgi:hypothetical protein
MAFPSLVTFSFFGSITPKALTTMRIC